VKGCKEYFPPRISRLNLGIVLYQSFITRVFFIFFKARALSYQINMVTGFGWSAGDIATAIRAIYKITQAFREAGGASEQYAETVTFLEALALTLNRLREYIDSNSSGKYKNNIVEQARLIKVEYDKLHKHIQEYHRLASSTSAQNQVKEAREKLKWAIDQLRDKVSKMKDGVSVPLQFLHTFLSLQILLVYLSVGVCKIESLIQHSRDDIKGVDRRLKEVSDTVRSNDSSLKDAIGSQQILLAAIRTGLEGKITEEAESLRQSQNAHSTNTLDALQQLSRDLQSTQDSIHRRLGQLDPADLLMELNEQKELILKMRDAVDSHLLDLLHTLKIHETKKRSPEWLPLVQTACTAFAAVIGVANFVLQRSMASNLKPR
jgi:hypothetical protein